MELAGKRIHAAELRGSHWLNSGPQMIEELRGHVVLVHFWDYTSVYCIHSLAYVKEWYKRYTEIGLRIIGVHTPQFPFAKDPENVANALKRFDLKYPVVLDNDHVIWTVYACGEWPAIFLMDRDGYVRYAHYGQGGYLAVEREILALLRETAYRGEMPELLEPLREMDQPGVHCYRATPAMDVGYLRGALGNIEGYNPESILMYEDPGVHLDGRFYLRGIWFSDRNSMRLDRPQEGHVAFSYRAVEVNLVLKRAGEARVRLLVEQDGKCLPPEICGDDAVVDGNGLSYIVVEEPRMYHVVRNKEFGEHELKLITDANGLAFYSISFVSGVMPEFSLISGRDEQSLKQ